MQVTSSNHNARAKQSEQPSPVGMLPWLICTLAALFYCYEYFLRITPSVMAYELRNAYHLNAGELGEMIAFYYFAYTPMQLIVGVLMDRYGPRRLLFSSCALCALGAYLFAATSNLYVAELGRFLIGFGSAFAFVGVLKLATIWLPLKYFPIVSGLTTALGMLGAILGDITLTSVVNAIGWRTTVSYSAVLGLILAVFIYWLVRDQRPDSSQQQTADHQDFRTLLTGLRQIFLKPQMWVVGIIGCLAYSSASAFAELWNIPYLMTAHGLSQQTAANYNALVFLGWVVGGPITGWFSEKVKQRRLPLIISGIMTSILFFTLIYLPNLNHLSLQCLLFGIGFFSSAQILVFVIACEITGGKIVGTAIAFTNMFVMIAGDALQPTIGRLLDANWQGQFNALGERLYDTHSYHYALLVLPICYFLVFFISRFLLRETHQART